MANRSWPTVVHAGASAAAHSGRLGGTGSRRAPRLHGNQPSIAHRQSDQFDDDGRRQPGDRPNRRAGRPPHAVRRHARPARRQFIGPDGFQETHGHPTLVGRSTRARGPSDRRRAVDGVRGTHRHDVPLYQPALEPRSRRAISARATCRAVSRDNFTTDDATCLDLSSLGVASHRAPTRPNDGCSPPHANRCGTDQASKCRPHGPRCLGWSTLAVVPSTPCRRRPRRGARCPFSTRRRQPRRSRIAV